jgi:hypothetical protein
MNERPVYLNDSSENRRGISSYEIRVLCKPNERWS